MNHFWVQSIAPHSCRLEVSCSQHLHKTLFSFWSSSPETRIISLLGPVRHYATYFDWKAINHCPGQWAGPFSCPIVAVLLPGRARVEFCSRLNKGPSLTLLNKHLEVSRRKARNWITIVRVAVEAIRKFWRAAESEPLTMKMFSLPLIEWTDTWMRLMILWNGFEYTKSLVKALL